MTGSDDPPKSGKNAQNAAREARLAAALRENLKRRKAQIRDKERARRSADAPAAGESDDEG